MRWSDRLLAGGVLVVMVVWCGGGVVVMEVRES